MTDKNKLTEDTDLHAHTLHCTQCGGGLAINEVYFLNARDPDRAMVHFVPCDSTEAFEDGDAPMSHLGTCNDEEYDPTGDEGCPGCSLWLRCPACGVDYSLHIRFCETDGKTRLYWAGEPASTTPYGVSDTPSGAPSAEALRAVWRSKADSELGEGNTMPDDVLSHDQFDRLRAPLSTLKMWLQSATEAHEQAVAQLAALGAGNPANGLYDVMGSLGGPRLPDVPGFDPRDGYPTVADGLERATRAITQAIDDLDYCEGYQFPEDYS